MKQRILLGLLLLLFSMTSLAQYTLKYQITGFDEKAPALKNALARLEVHQKSLKEALSPKTMKELTDSGVHQIEEAIKPFGYFKPTIHASLSHQGKEWTAHYQVIPGPPLHITLLNIKVIGPGAKNKTIQKTLKKLKLKTDQVFNVPQYEDAKSTLLKTIQNEGYLRAKMDKDLIVINLRNYFCSVTMIVNTGPRFYFGPIFFSKTPLNDKFLMRYVQFKHSEPVSYPKLFDLQQALNGGNYFQSVSVVPRLDKTTKSHHVPIQVTLQMRKRKEYRFGLGYGTNSGMRVTLGYKLHWVNQWGHNINLLAKFSHIENNLSAQYVIPGKIPQKDRYTITASIYEQRPKDGESLMQSIGVGRITSFDSWQRVLSLDYQLERYRFNDDQDYKNARMLLPSITFTRTFSDDPINPNNGSRFSILLRGSSDDIASTVDFVQATLQYQLIHTFFRSNRFIFRADYGYTIAHDYVNKLPLSKNYYAGGMNSVRGYKYKELGPGRYLVVGSLEYQRRIYGNWYAAVFYDIGNAINHFNDQLKRGTGVGVIWQSPVGPIRVYVARPLNRKGFPLRLEFSLGPSL